MTPSLTSPTPLTRAVLRDIAADAARGRSWSTLSPEPGRRASERLRRDEHVEVWAIAWLPGHDTGFHDHDASAGALCVVQGSLVEERLTLSGRPSARSLAVGDSVDFGPTHVHRVRCAAPGGALSVHAYSPPLRRLGAYEVDEDGALIRRPLEPDAELGRDEG